MDCVVAGDDDVMVNRDVSTGAVGEIKSIGIVVDSDASSRFLAESNCCKRFCRPVPNHSAMIPDSFRLASAKVGLFRGPAKLFRH